LSPSFWQSFEKRASGSGSGNAAGGGFTGTGKGNLGTAERDHINGTMRSPQDTKVDTALLDRDRTCRTEDPFSTGPEFQDETNPHIRY
jgi:hypothetical protein